MARKEKKKMNENNVRVSEILLLLYSTNLTQIQTKITPIHLCGRCLELNQN